MVDGRRSSVAPLNHGMLDFSNRTVWLSSHVVNRRSSDAFPRETAHRFAFRFVSISSHARFVRMLGIVPLRAVVSYASLAARFVRSARDLPVAQDESQDLRGPFGLSHNGTKGLEHLGSPRIQCVCRTASHPQSL